MHSIKNISKAVSLIVTALLFLSFTTIYMLSARDWKKIEKNAKIIF